MSRGSFNRIYHFHPISLVQAQQQPSSISNIQNGQPTTTVRNFDCPNVNKINFIQDYNATTRVETKTVYDSRKEAIKPHPLQFQTILSLKQIQKDKRNRLRQYKMQARSTSQQKLYVSIARSSRSTSKQQRGSAPVSPDASNNTFKHLSTLYNKRLIVQKVECQLEESKPFNIFCE